MPVAEMCVWAGGNVKLGSGVPDVMPPASPGEVGSTFGCCWVIWAAAGGIGFGTVAPRAHPGSLGASDSVLSPATPPPRQGDEEATAPSAHGPQTRPAKEAAGAGNRWAGCR